MTDSLSGLNPAQHEAVVHESGPLMVLAGPGTGKTRVIAHRIAHMMQARAVSPESIVAVTYTVKAAHQLRDRLLSLVGPAADQVRVHTFHGLGLRILRRFADEVDVRISRFDGLGANAGGIIDSAQQTRLFREIILDHDLCQRDRAAGLDAVIDRITGYREALSDAAISTADASKFCTQSATWLDRGEDHAGNCLDAEAVAAERERVRMLTDALRAMELFESACRERGWLTFSDLISLPIRILRSSSRAARILRDEWRHIIVDEFQDVNAAQIELLRLLMPAREGGPAPRAPKQSAKPRPAGSLLFDMSSPEPSPEVEPFRSTSSGPDLCVVGDDDQSIYEFRGADDLAFAKFGKIWPGHAVVRLTENFRSTPTIVKVSGSVIGRAETRYAPDKVIRAAGSRAEPPTCPVDCVNLSDDLQDGEVIAAMILTDRNERSGAAWSDYAVVVRAHTDADRIRSALQIEGVPSVAAREGTPAEDEGVKDALAWVELLAEPHAAHAASRLLSRSPFSVSPRELTPLRARYRGELTRFESGDPGAADPAGFVEWLRTAAPASAPIARFADLHAELSLAAGQLNAADAIARIVAAADPAHADLLSLRERAERVKNLVGLLKFAKGRQPRLDAPGDARAFWSYYNDLSGDEQLMRDASLNARVDGLSDAPDEEKLDAVSIITAHSAKGLEFDTVFVPRVSPGHGYGSVKNSEGRDLPNGLIQRDDGRTPTQRAAAEARRLFYVACTRAERRLVLLSKKNKSRSNSTHYYEEIVFDTKCNDAIRILQWKDLLERAGSLGFGQAYGWSRPGSAGEIDSRVSGFKGVERRRAVFERARAEIRTTAAAALDGAATGQVDTVLSSAERLGDAAMHLGALTAAETTGVVPAWALNHVAGTFIQRVLEEAGRDPKSAAGQPGFAPGLNPPLRLSYSRIAAYLKCPRCYYLSEVLGLKDDSGPAQVVGTAVHGALQVYSNELRAAEADGNPLPTRERLLALGREWFFRAWPRHREADKVALDQVLSQLGMVHGSLRDPSASIVEVERNAEFKYGPHSFNCRIDRIDLVSAPSGREVFRIVDYKTGQPSKPLRNPPPDDLQFGIYALALDHLYPRTGDDEHSGFAEYWLLSTGERGRIDLADLDRTKVRAQIDEVIAGMLAGHWDPNPKCEGQCRTIPVGLNPESPESAESPTPATSGH